VVVTLVVRRYRDTALGSRLAWRGHPPNVTAMVAALSSSVHRLRPVSVTYDELAAALPEVRRELVLNWLEESIGDCTSCAKPVRRNQPRNRDGAAGFGHIDCQSVAAAPDLEEPEARAVAARARRSDWG
jgi:hypothetical protein